MRGTNPIEVAQLKIPTNKLFYIRWYQLKPNGTVYSWAVEMLKAEFCLSLKEPEPMFYSTPVPVIHLFSGLQ